MNWQERSACKGLGPDWFFAPARSVGIRKALAVCAGCPVRAECLAYAEENEADETDLDCLAGVYGGLTAKDRQERKQQ